MRIILGSQSPRRVEIMNFFALPFIQVSSDFDEESIPFQGDPILYSQILSQKKNEVIAKTHPDEIILTADTVVFCGGRIYNKPRDQNEAFEFLRDLCGNWQSVITSVTVSQHGQIWTKSEESKLLFHHLSNDQIHKFHKECYFLDKAGGYAIEKGGNLIVQKMEGSYYNILGLPIDTVRQLLLNVGIDLWDFLKGL